MSFTSLDFVVFFIFLGLCLVLACRTGRQSAQTWLLLLFSYGFYLSSGMVGVLVITLLALLDFGVGRRLRSSSSEETCKRWLWAGLTANIGALVFFQVLGVLGPDGSGSTARPAHIRTGHASVADHRPLLLYFCWRELSPGHLLRENGAVRTAYRNMSATWCTSPSSLPDLL